MAGVIAHTGVESKHKKQIDLMNEHIAQLISITTFGNDFLINDKLDQFYNETKCYIPVRHIRFLESTKVELTCNPIEWFKILKKEGCQRLNLTFQYSDNNISNPDHFSAGIIGGGGTWRIESIYTDHSRIWSIQRQYNYPNAFDGKYCDLVFRRQFKKHQLIEKHINNVEYSKKQLGSALWNISEFANNLGYEKWADFFENALDKLYGSDPKDGCFYDDIIPDNRFTLSERQLIFSISKAWCFGIHGSWNDMRFNDKLSTERYLKLTATLYDEIINGILSITNK